MAYDSQFLDVSGLATSDGEFIAEIYDPSTGVIETKYALVSAGSTTLTLPGFTDDIAIHIHR